VIAVHNDIRIADNCHGNFSVELTKNRILRKTAFFIESLRDTPPPSKLCIKISPEGGWSGGETPQGFNAPSPCRVICIKKPPQLDNSIFLNHKKDLFTGAA
tara:strand:- start:220 stop:522 length:303 start_codon:yes stop_codon:yes gene_type:complete